MAGPSPGCQRVLRTDGRLRQPENGDDGAIRTEPIRPEEDRGGVAVRATSEMTVAESAVASTRWERVR